MTSYAPLLKESTKAFAAFCAYRDMGEERTLAAVGKALGKSATLMEGWSAKHKWVARVKSIAISISKANSAAETKRILTDAKGWAERASHVREVQFELSGLLVTKAREMLGWPLVKTIGKDGAEIPAARWAMGDAARMIDIADRLQCLATGQPTGDGTRVEVTVNTALTIEQKEARMREIFGLQN